MQGGEDCLLWFAWMMSNLRGSHRPAAGPCVSWPADCSTPSVQAKLTSAQRLVESAIMEKL